MGLMCSVGAAVCSPAWAPPAESHSAPRACCGMCVPAALLQEPGGQATAFGLQVQPRQATFSHILIDEAGQASAFMG